MRTAPDAFAAPSAERPLSSPAPLDRDALEDALADILRDAARREGLEV
jgi:hypothetical protein